MLASQYAQVILDLVQQHGDLDVEKWMPAKGRHEAPVPALAYARRFNAVKGSREPVPHFYQPDYDTPAQKGHPVIRV